MRPPRPSSPRFRVVASLLALLATAGVARANITYRPGLMQALFKVGSENGFKTSANGVPVLASNLVATASADPFADSKIERVPYPLVDAANNVANPVTSSTWSWPDTYAVFAYEGEIYVTAGTTYTCYGRFDDGSALVLDGNLVLLQREDSGYNKQPQVWGDYVATRTGWVPFNGWIWDWTGGKATRECAYALQYNTSSVRNSFSDTGKWSRFADPGDMSFLRTDTGETFTTILSAEPSGNNLLLNVCFTNVPAAATLVAFFGDHDRGASADGWDGSLPLGPVAAGTTAATPYTVTGSGASKYLRLRLANPTKAAGDTSFSSVFEEWTEPVNRDLSPVVSLSLSSIAYTNALYEASIESFGFGSSSCDLELQLARTSDFASIDFSVATTGVDTVSVALPVSGLVTNTAYYARLVATASATGEDSTTDPIGPHATLLPTAAAGTLELSSIGFSTAAYLWTPTDLGDDSSWADLTLELSTDIEFSSLAREVHLGQVEAADLGATHEISLEGLSGATTYYARLRIENEWGFVSRSGTVSGRTDNRPFGVSDIGYVDEGGVRTISVALTWIDCPEVKAVLWYGDRRNPTGDAYLVGTNVLSATGLFTWTVPSESSATRYVRIIASGVVNGETGTRYLSATIAPGAKSIILGGVAGYDSADTMLRLHEGDRAILPPLAGKAFYESSSDRVATVDGEVLAAAGAGMAAVRAYDATGANPTTFGVLVMPRAPAGGAVYVMKDAAIAWNDAASWTDASGADASDWPRRPADIAMIPGWDAGKTVTVSGAVSLRGLYVGGVGENGYTVRIQGSGSPTLSLVSPGKLKSALVRICSNATTKDKRLVLRLGGSAASGTLNVSVPSAKGAEFDNGASLDETPGSDALKLGNAQIGFDFANVSVAAGAELAFTHGNPNGGDSVDLSGNARFTGSGVLAADTAGRLFKASDFTSFAGTIRLGSRARPGNWAYGDREGLFWFRQGLMPLATLDVAGFFTGSDATSAGIANSGCKHDWQAGGDVLANVWPQRQWTLQGGDLILNREYKNFGEGVVWSNATDRIVVERGLTALQLIEQDNANSATNALSVGTLVHDGKGTLFFRNASSMKFGNTSRSIVDIGGLSDLLEGSDLEDDPENHVQRIIPWMAVPYNGSWGVPAFPGVSPEGSLVGPDRIAVGNLSNGGPGKSVFLSWGTLSIVYPCHVNSVTIDCGNKDSDNWPTVKDANGNDTWPHRYRPWYNLGPGQQLFLDGGALVLLGGSRFGHQDGYVDAGNWYSDKTTLPYGGHCGTLHVPKTLYVYATGSESSPSQIWTPVFAPEGFVSGYYGFLRLGGSQTNIEDSVTVNSGTLALGSPDGTIPTTLQVPIHVIGGNSKLRLDAAGTFTTREATINLEDVGGYPARIEMNVNDAVWEMTVDGVTIPRGTWGSSTSGAEFVDDAHFLGTGVLTVYHDQLTKPTMMILR